MTILLAFAGAAILIAAAVKLGVFHHLAGDEHDLWPAGADEPTDAYLDRQACEAMWQRTLDRVFPET